MNYAVAEAIEHLSEDSGRVPCSRYGYDSESCAPWAVALLLIAEEHGLEGDDSDILDHYMGLVVNDHDDVLSLVSDHGHSLVGTELEYLIEEAADLNGDES